MCSPRLQIPGPRLISNFTGAMRDDARSVDLQSSDYQVDNGVEKLLSLIRQRLHITDINLETEALYKYFNQLARKKGETFMNISTLKSPPTGNYTVF